MHPAYPVGLDIVTNAPESIYPHKTIIQLVSVAHFLKQFLPTAK